MSEQGQPSSQTSGLAPNIASVLCYVCTLVTGIIFLVIEKENKDVRFHAWQAIILGAASFILYIAVIILTAIFSAIASFLGAIIGILYPIICLAFFVFWIICMVKAYQGERYKIPFLGDIAEKQAAK